jgi:hypothetical protein
MRSARIAALSIAVSALVAAGCSSQPAYTQAQLNAIETRVVEAAFDETFNAASGALFDAGYIITMSDRQGGLVTGEQTRKVSGWELWFGTSGYYQGLAATIQVRTANPDRCLVRVKTAVNGQTRVNKEAIDEIWVLMQRQVLMSEPPLLEPATPGPG